jgi:translocation and assembly module TamB
VLILASVSVFYWLLRTESGRDFALSQAAVHLPAGMSLHWGNAEGVLAGPLILHDVDFRYDDIHFRAGYLRLDPHLAPLFRKRLLLDTLELRDAALNLPASEEKPFELPTWPDMLPQLELPLGIRVDTIAVDDLRISQTDEPIVDIRKIRGGIMLGNGRLRARRLSAESNLGNFTINGDYLPARNFHSDLVATAVFPERPGRTQAQLGLVARGNLNRMNIALAGKAPEPVQATLTLRGKRRPVWQFTAATEALDLGLILPPSPGTEPTSAYEPISFDLHADGKGGDATLQGTLARGDLKAVIEPSQIRQDNQILTFDTLLVAIFNGHIRLQGTMDFNELGNPRFQLAATASDLNFSTDAVGTTPPTQTGGVPRPIGVAAELELNGVMRSWALTGNAVITRDTEQAKLDLDIAGDGERARIQTLQAEMPTGTLDATGELVWAPMLAWDIEAKLDGFDPGYFAPGWDGAVSGLITSQGQARTESGYDAELTLSNLAGELRNRTLTGQGEFALHGEEGEGHLALGLGNSRIEAKGKVGERIELRVDLQPAHLDDFLPGGSGVLRGHVHLTGDKTAPDITADLAGEQLRWNDYGAQTLSLSGQLPWRGRRGELALTGQSIQAGILFDSLRVNASGAMEDLHLNASANTTQYGAISIGGHARKAAAEWRGALEQLRISPIRGDPWNLRGAVPFRAANTEWSFDDACLIGTGGLLCATADWPKQGVTLSSKGLPLEMLHPWLPKNEGRNLLLRGTVTVDGKLRPLPGGIEGNLHLASADGGLRLGDRSRREILRYDNFSLNLEFDQQHIRTYFGIGFKGDGYIDARAETGWDASSALQGDLHMHMSRLFWLELVSPDLTRPNGVLRGHISLRGTRGQPALGGQLLLEDFTGELPALGVTLSEGRGNLDALPDGSARISASAKSGEGTLTVDGQLSWYGDSTPLQLHIRGQNVLISNTSELRAVANPDLQFSFAGKNTMVLRGQVSIPSADIDLERLDRGTSVSEDVVVVDPIDPEVEASSPLDLDLNIIVGQGDGTGSGNVKIAGFGLKGTLDGAIHVRARPGRQMMATGLLYVDGRYKAYGQELQITRGQLTWSNNVIAAPRINLRAERRTNDVTAGIDVTGNAQAPRIQIWSDPAMSQSEALGYLMFGRSLEGVSRSQAQQITAASAALSAGGGLLAAQLGAKIGLDDAGVTQSRALGGSVIGVGKYLSPRLYVGYGVSMIGSGQVLILKYLLRHGFDIELESSTVENRGSINWRRER